MVVKSMSVILVNNNLLEGTTYDSSGTYLVKQLTALNYEVSKFVVLPPKPRLVEAELESNARQFDYVVLVDSTGTCITYKAVANVFHQLLVKVGSIFVPEFAKILECKTNGTILNPVIYTQGVFAINLNATDCLKLLFESTVKPCLTNINRTHFLKRTLCFDTKRPDDSIAKLGGEKVVITLKDNEVNIMSSDLESLIDTENAITEKLGDNLISVEQTLDLEQLVYEYSAFPHVRTAIECIEKCFSMYGPENVFTGFNGGKDCTVLLHLMIAVLKKRYPGHKAKPYCMYVQNANPFQDIDTFILHCQQYFDLEVITISASIKEALEQVLRIKPNLKVCLMGTRRTDPFSEHLKDFQMTDSNWPQVMRCSPLLDWHYSQVWDYLLTLHVPYCTLYDEGYTSLGGINNTVKNPSLRLEDKVSGCNHYLPAYKLLDAAEERKGRVMGS